ncbi:uncharacterized protein BX664DRAFT_165093 [Halteromyces radiatus]|uniref:uncharacterized protein n=1 Tax=Halteromyces radiatus TaxID=101107 RepID=UPI00221E58DA|nr:uncharacterized protein BX664DRAFT_165093 [Halteromyces radiatus]KAI8086777.1 hypothetical protein BX664DRAFT_165093 [Halteromyces radiatus]
MKFNALIAACILAFVAVGQCEESHFAMAERGLDNAAHNATHHKSGKHHPTGHGKRDATAASVNHASPTPHHKGDKKHHGSGKKHHTSAVSGSHGKRDVVADAASVHHASPTPHHKGGKKHHKGGKQHPPTPSH